MSETHTNYTLIAERLMSLHLGGTDWKFKWTTAFKTTAGTCSYKNKVIKVSKQYAIKAGEKEFADTMLHEIAHALVPGEREHHGLKWKAVAKKIGCSAKRCHSITFTEPKYKFKCDCNEIYHRHKMCSVIRDINEGKLKCTICKKKFTLI
jgi:predicted SprT family Zn-dependent metalloprotease